MHRLIAEGGKNPICARTDIELFGDSCSETINTVWSPTTPTESLGSRKAGILMFEAIQCYLTNNNTRENIANKVSLAASGPGHVLQRNRGSRKR